MTYPVAYRPNIGIQTGGQPRYVSPSTRRKLPRNLGSYKIPRVASKINIDAAVQVSNVTRKAIRIGKLLRAGTPIGLALIAAEIAYEFYTKLQESIQLNGWTVDCRTGPLDYGPTAYWQASPVCGNTHLFFSADEGFYYAGPIQDGQQILSAGYWTKLSGAYDPARLNAQFSRIHRVGDVIPPPPLEGVFAENYALPRSNPIELPLVDPLPLPGPAPIGVPRPAIFPVSPGQGDRPIPATFPPGRSIRPRPRFRSKPKAAIRPGTILVEETVVNVSAKNPRVYQRTNTHRKRPPNKRTKEKKGVYRSTLGNAVVGAIGEGLDVLDAIYDAIPKRERKLCTAANGSTKNRFGGENRYFGRSFKSATPQSKAICVFKYIELTDFDTIMENLIYNQIQDTLFGQLGKKLGKAANRNRLHGDLPIGFQTGPAL